MIFRVFVNFKKGILDPEAEAINKTIKNMGFKGIKSVSKGSFFDIEFDNKKNYIKDIEKISKELLSNPVIEDFKVIKKN